MDGTLLRLETLVLHISSAAECARLGVASATCFVLPGTAPTGTLTVKKVVVNDNGGTKDATDFKFKVNNLAATSFIADPAFADTLHGKNTVPVPSGAYSVVEDGTPIPATARSSPQDAAASWRPVAPPSARSRTTTRRRSVTPLQLAMRSRPTTTSPRTRSTVARPATPSRLRRRRSSETWWGSAVSGDLQSLSVLFNSYACEDSPLWNNSQC